MTGGRGMGWAWPALMAAPVMWGVALPLSAQTREGGIYPGARWERASSPEAVGWSSEKLAEAWEIADQIGSGAVLVVHGGRIVAEWGDTQKRYDVYSVRKQLLSGLLGRAVEAGELRLDMTLAQLGIQDKSPLTEAERRATLADLLTSRSGVFHPAAYEAREHKVTRPPRGSHAPGTFWYYNNWDFNVLGSVYERAHGTDIFSAFANEIAQPIGMESFDPARDGTFERSRSSEYPAYLFQMNAYDLARYGLLWLRRGRWEDRQVIPEAWVDQSTELRVPATLNELQGFGYLWWVYPQTEGLFGASGKGNQKVTVWPERDLVVVHLASTKWLGLFGSQVSDGDYWRLFFAIARAHARAPSGPSPDS